MELIDKTAVIAEIERVLNSYDPNEITSGRYALADLRDFINTIEVKEVDLEEEDVFIEKAIGWIDYNNRDGGCFFNGWEKDFRKYMEGE
jgi:hypothetical protein